MTSSDLVTFVLVLQSTVAGETYTTQLPGFSTLRECAIKRDVYLDYHWYAGKRAFCYPERIPLRFK